MPAGAEAEPVNPILDTSPEVTEQMAFLAGWLPAPPGRVLDVGCGRGELALALSRAGYAVTAVDIDPEAVAAAGARGVTAVESDIAEYAGGPFDAIVFSLSLHHVGGLADVVQRARALLAPGGTLVVDEFAWERADAPTAAWFYDAGAVLAGAGLNTCAEDGSPRADPYAHWLQHHRDEEHLHPGESMVQAISEAFTIRELVRVPYLYRYLAGELSDPTGMAIFATLQHIERLRIADGSLPAVGLRLRAQVPSRDDEP
jgi:SAM-dependent methyltransferase